MKAKIDPTAPAHRSPLLALVLLGAIGGCPQGPFQPKKPDDVKPQRHLPAGATCAATGDCPADQVCVDDRCHYAATCVAGEVLASAAKAQLTAGDFGGAVRAYDEAIVAFDHNKTPVPPRILCDAAIAALRAGPGQDARERAARRADACLRGSLPGDKRRREVIEGLTRLRYDGLDPTNFDKPQPPERFFTKEPTRPTVDAIQIDIDLPKSDDKGYDDVKQALEGDASRRAIADCFLQDWDIRHNRQVKAALLLKLKSEMHDMVYYDVYKPEASVSQTSLAQDGFEPCTAAALTDVLKDALPKNMGGKISWQQPFEVTAHLQ